MADAPKPPQESEEPTIKVTDRRRFARDESAADQPASETPADKPHSTPPPPRPPMDFTTFILSLASTALIQMGEAPDPDTGEHVKQLDLARETINMLGMLREKTRGNLTDEETRFFDALLYDLRLRYVEATKR